MNAMQEKGPFSWVHEHIHLYVVRGKTQHIKPQIKVMSRKTRVHFVYQNFNKALKKKSIPNARANKKNEKKFYFAISLRDKNGLNNTRKRPLHTARTHSTKWVFPSICKVSWIFASQVLQQRLFKVEQVVVQHCSKQQRKNSYSFALLLGSAILLSRLKFWIELIFCGKYSSAFNTNTTFLPEIHLNLLNVSKETVIECSCRWYCCCVYVSILTVLYI